MNTNKERINAWQNYGLNWFLDAEMPDHDHDEACTCQEMFAVIQGLYDKRQEALR